MTTDWCYDHPSIWANLLHFLTFLTMARHTSDFTGSWQISSGIGQSIKIWRGWCFTKKRKDDKKNETKTFMKTLGFSPGGTVKTLYMPLSDLGAKGPEIPQVLRRLIEALFHCFPGHFALGRPYGAKKKHKSYNKIIPVRGPRQCGGSKKVVYLQCWWW